MAYSREQMREYMTQYREAKRQQARHALGNRCVRCGATENLEFHHRDPNDKTDTIANMITAAKDALDAELQKCELVCHDCHMKESKRSGVFRVNVGWNHGTISGYRDKGCRCTACCDAYAAGLARHNERRKAQRRQRRLSRSTA